MCQAGHFNSDFILIYLRVVQGCNLNCSHCFTLGNQDKFKMAPLDQIETYLQSISKNVDPKQVVVYIHGGEPFLAPLDYHRQVNQLIRKAFPETKLDIIPQTNLMYNLDDEFISFLKEEYGGQIGVSWDPEIRFGSTSKALSEDLFFKNYRQLVDHEIRMAVAITVQKHLLKRDPVEVVAKLDGANSIDFEFLTYFNSTTENLRVRNSDWSEFYSRLLKYYSQTETSWSLPQADLFTKSMAENRIYQCKCNCCLNRTFTMNCDGTAGLCAYDAYYQPLTSVSEMSADWPRFADKARQKHLEQAVQSVHTLCQSCEYYDFCGGNCEPALFSENDTECPMSKKALKYQFENLGLFQRKLKLAGEKLNELRR